MSLETLVYIHEPTVSLENGYVSLAVGESRKVKINFRYTGDGMVLNQGEKYSINFRGSWVQWWKWGTLEVRPAFLRLFGMY